MSRAGLEPATNWLKGHKTISRQRTLSAVYRELDLLRTIFNFAEHNDWIVKGPFRKGASLISKAREHQRDRVLTLKEEVRLLDAYTEERAHLSPWRKSARPNRWRWCIRIERC